MIAQGASDDLKPNWALIRHYAKESGFGDLEPTTDEFINEISRQGYDDWEYVGGGFFWENHESEINGEGEFVYKVTICWKVEIRKWEE